MIRSLFIAKTGLDAQQTQLDITSNNLANVSTSGFKKSRAVFEDLVYQTLRQPGAQSTQQTQLPTGLQIGTGVRPVASERIFTQGNLSQTMRLDDLEPEIWLFVKTWTGHWPGGEREYERLLARVRRDDYRLLPFVEDFGAAVGSADLVVSRAGGSVWEIAAAGKAAVLVPYPHATSDHQRTNARYFAAAGGALIVDDADAHDAVPKLVAELFGDEARLRAMSDAMRAAAKPDAAERIADELVELAAAHR